MGQLKAINDIFTKTVQYETMLVDTVNKALSTIPTQAPVRDQLMVALYIVWAMLLGGIIGWEREKLAKAPGLRTHMLIAGASAMVVTIGFAATSTIGDPSRSIHGVITGMGFLCAGAIFQSKKGNVSGLTTSASMLYTAAIGCAVGAGFGVSASFSAVLAILVLRVLGYVRYKKTSKELLTDAPQDKS